MSPLNTMHGLLYGILFDNVLPDKRQKASVKMLLVAWYLTEAWLPGRVGYKRKLHLVQARACCNTARSNLYPEAVCIISQVAAAALV